MKNSLVALSMIASLSACVGGSEQAAAPNLVNGQYFMAGDSTCSQVRQLSATRVMCIDSAGQETGYRDAMTSQELQMYQHNQQMQMMQAQLASQQAAQSAAQMAAWSNSMQQTQYPRYSAPQVTPLSLPGSGQIRCINTGMYTNCRY